MIVNLTISFVERRSYTNGLRVLYSRSRNKSRRRVIGNDYNCRTKDVWTFKTNGWLIWWKCKTIGVHYKINIGETCYMEFCDTFSRYYKTHRTVLVILSNKRHIAHINRGLGFFWKYRCYISFCSEISTAFVYGTKISV